MDDGKMEKCPFDQNHNIRSCKFEYHLISCKSVRLILIKR